MKKSLVRNQEAQYTEDESAMVEQVCRPFRLSIVSVGLALSILLPFAYLLLEEKPGSRLPKTFHEELTGKSEVKTESAPDKFKELDKAILKATNEPSFENYFKLSFEFYNAGKFSQSITAAEKALSYDSTSAAAYNNICSAYNELKEYQKAIVACKKALTLDPEFELAKNNLKWAEESIK